ncbi:MAG: tyrosine-type recombinase/integrase [Lachnospiraceae bacterium]|nr:tyrosine-type recombinase/integrase [Lachnospiraceae bacterium]
MANKKTVALTRDQYDTIIKLMKTGAYNFRPNEQVMTALVLEANLGLRIEDILRLRLNSFVKDRERYRLDITEQKTGKKREFTVPNEVYDFIEKYCIKNDISKEEPIFKTKERNVQTYLKKVVDYLEYDNISTHSFRKFFATEIYLNNDYNIVLVQKLLQHSSTAITQRYIGIGTRELEEALEKHIQLPD